MTTRPSNTFEWALDTNFDTNFGPSGSAWHNEPNKILPIPTRVSQGYVPSQSLDAESLNYLINSHGQHLGYLYDSINTASLDAVTPVSFSHPVSPWAGGFSFGWEATQSPVPRLGIRSINSASVWTYDLTSNLPYSASVTTLNFAIDPGVGIAVEGNRMRVHVVETVQRFGASFDAGSSGDIIYSGFADATTNTQQIQVALTNFVLAPSASQSSETTHYHVVVYSGISGANSADGDSFFGMHIEYTVNGITNRRGM